MPDVRVFADVPPANFMKAVCPNLGPAASRAAAPAYLALSGGGADGAYGAGVLNGWTESGTRPEFTIVSGVSTGALIAPFAFLGPAYDGVLRHLYTSGVAESLLSMRLACSPCCSAPGYSAVSPCASSSPSTSIGPMLARIAAEYAKGRCLAVVTTDLDAQRAVVWDMGRIASYGTPAALELFRDVLTASASVPVVFPPVLIDVAANGRTIQEMHVDGAVTWPVFTLPAAFLSEQCPTRAPFEARHLCFDQQRARSGFPGRAGQKCRYCRSVRLDDGQGPDQIRDLSAPMSSRKKTG